jgi:hypothetical protein
MTQRDRRVTLAMGIIAGVGVLAALLDIAGIAPGWAGKATPLLLAALITYLLSERARIEALRYTVRHIDRKLGKVPRPPKAEMSGKGGKPGKASKAKDKPGSKPKSDNYRTVVWKGLEFRSISEIKVAQALDRAGVLFIPSSRARFTTSASGDGRDNREVDFLVCHDGKWGVLEVDGPYHSADHDKWRDDRFRAHGVEVIARYPSDRCHNDPGGVVADFLAKLTSNNP